MAASLFAVLERRGLVAAPVIWTLLRNEADKNTVELKLTHVQRAEFSRVWCRK